MVDLLKIIENYYINEEIVEINILEQKFGKENSNFFFFLKINKYLVEILSSDMTLREQGYYGEVMIGLCKKDNKKVIYIRVICFLKKNTIVIFFLNKRFLLWKVLY